MSRSGSEDLARLVRKMAEEESESRRDAGGPVSADDWDPHPSASIRNRWAAAEPLPRIPEPRRSRGVGVAFAVLAVGGVALGAAAYRFLPVSSSSEARPVRVAAETSAPKTMTRAAVVPAPAPASSAAAVPPPATVPGIEPPTMRPAVQMEAPPTAAPAAFRAAPTEPPEPAASTKAARAPSLKAVEPPPPSEPQTARAAAPAEPPAKAAPEARVLSSDGAAGLVQRGQDILKTGDVASARLLFRRAAEGSDANGALLLAATYDPSMLGLMKARGNLSDLDKARFWYQRAKALGATDAEQRLAALEQR